jgi:antitoxin CptB
MDERPAANADRHADYNRLRWRCRRGMKELDAVLLRYLEHNYGHADARQQQTFEHILNMPDPELYFLLMGRTESDNRDIAALVSILRNLPRH